LIKGIITSVLDYLGFKNRYDFEVLENKYFHPGMSAKIILDREQIGVIGRVHPSFCKDEIYMCEISMNKLLKPVKALKYKEAPKYPSITKDVSFIVKKDVTSKEIEQIIKKAGNTTPKVHKKLPKNAPKKPPFAIPCTEPT
jgi:phenylalanyl-tRNA synthetase beta chain